MVDKCWFTVFEIVQKVCKCVVNGCFSSIAIEYFDRIRNHDADQTLGFDDSVEFSRGFHPVSLIFR